MLLYSSDLFFCVNACDVMMIDYFYDNDILIIKAKTFLIDNDY